jgi:hypothetical protein
MYFIWKNSNFTIFLSTIISQLISLGLGYNIYIHNSVFLK